MSARADIEADLAKAEADLAKAVTNLAEACADPAETEVCLPKAFFNLTKEKFDLAKADADLAKARADLAKARASCRTARIGLARLNRAEGMPIGYRSEPAHMAHEAVLQMAHTNRRNSNDDLRLARAVEESATRQPRPRKESGRLTGRFSEQDVSSKDTGAWRSLAWQAVELSSLTLAYLQYYYIDVNLQIAMLPPPVGSLLVG